MNFAAALALPKLGACAGAEPWSVAPEGAAAGGQQEQSWAGRFPSEGYVVRNSGSEVAFCFSLSW